MASDSVGEYSRPDLRSGEMMEACGGWQSSRGEEQARVGRRRLRGGWSRRPCGGSSGGRRGGRKQHSDWHAAMASNAAALLTALGQQPGQQFPLLASPRQTWGCCRHRRLQHPLGPRRCRPAAAAAAAIAAALLPQPLHWRRRPPAAAAAAGAGTWRAWPPAPPAPRAVQDAAAGRRRRPGPPGPAAGWSCGVRATSTRPLAADRGAFGSGRASWGQLCAAQLWLSLALLWRCPGRTG